MKGKRIRDTISTTTAFSLLSTNSRKLVTNADAVVSAALTAAVLGFSDSE